MVWVKIRVKVGGSMVWEGSRLGGSRSGSRFGPRSGRVKVRGSREGVVAGRSRVKSG